MQNKIEDLRNHLFATLEELRDKENPMDINRAKAVSQVAQSIIDSARVECDYIKLGYSIKSNFVELEIPQPSKLSQKPIANGGIYSDVDPNRTAKLAAGIKDMRGKFAAKEPA